MLVLSAMLAPESSGEATTSRACCDELLANTPPPQASAPTTNAISHEPKLAGISRRLGQVSVPADATADVLAAAVDRALSADPPSAVAMRSDSEVSRVDSSGSSTSRLVFAREMGTTLLAAGFFVVSAYFVYRSFYNMRIEGASA